jgi:hypothetical protein
MATLAAFFTGANFFLCRKVTFDLVVEGQPFIKGIQSLAKAVGAFFYLSFVAGIHYPQAS